MHIIAHRPQIPVAATVHNEALASTAEHMAKEFVLPIEPVDVNKVERSPSQSKGNLSILLTDP